MEVPSDEEEDRRGDTDRSNLRDDQSHAHNDHHR